MLPVGNPAIGNDFIDREREVAQILNALEKDNVLLIAPRRFGKTSIMRKVEAQLLGRDEICVFLEVEDVKSPQRFLSEMVMELMGDEKIERRNKLISAFGNAFQWFKDNVEEIGISSIFKAKLRSSIEKDLKDDWIEKSNLIFDIIKEANTPVYFIIDEFPIAIKNMERDEAKQFIHWFRKLRQISGNLRFVIGGSVSMDRVVRDIGGISVINDFKRVHISGFQKQVVFEIIERIFEEEGWEYKQSFGNTIVGCIGESYIPYFVAIMLSAIKEECDLRDATIDDELIDKIYNHRLLGNEGKHFFEHYFHRLKIFYTDMDEKAARAILRNVCNADYYPIEYAFDIFKTETGSNDYEKFMDLIADLSNDFYVEYDSKLGLKFYSKMLKDWWRVYHGLIE